MIPTSIKSISSVLHAKFIGRDTIVSSISTDSRVYVKDCLFVALIGKNFDAHKFVEHAILYGGCIAIIVNKKFNFNIPQLIVKDTKLALIQLASWLRKLLKVKIIAITGSSGKTSVKEITSKILNQNNEVLYTKKNFNNEIGISLTLLKLNYKHKFLVIELGAKNIGDIGLFANILNAKVVLINNISVSHLESFKCMRNIAETKSEIINNISNSGKCIINKDSNDWNNWKKFIDIKKVLFFSIYKKNNVHFFANKIISSINGTKFHLYSPYGRHSIYTPLIGEFNVANILASCAISFVVGIDLEKILLVLNKIKYVPGRMNLIILKKNKLILDDSYNANIDSTLNAIKILNNTKSYKVFVIGDLLELGDQELNYHKLLGKFISYSSINEILSIGDLSYFISKFSKRGTHFYSKKSLISYLIKLIEIHNEITILIKGSRKNNMEDIVYNIQEYFNANVDN